MAFRHSTDGNIREIQDREMRRQNLGLFSVPESAEEENVNRVKDDVESVRKVLKSIDADVPLDKVLRLGERDSESEAVRPVMIKTKSVTDNKKVLSKASRLQKSEDTKNIYINRDMTPLERAQRKKLVDLRKEKVNMSKTLGEEVSWVIRRGQVVKGRRPEPKTSAIQDK